LHRNARAHSKLHLEAFISRSKRIFFCEKNSLNTTALGFYNYRSTIAAARAKDSLSKNAELAPNHFLIDTTAYFPGRVILVPTDTIRYLEGPLSARAGPRAGQIISIPHEYVKAIKSRVEELNQQLAIASCYIAKNLGEQT
jgi:hypothetical protein